MFAESDLTPTLADDLTAWDWGQAAIVLVAAVVLARVLRIVIRRAFARSPADDFLGDLIGRIAAYVTVAVGIVYSLEGLGVAIAPILGALGIAGIAIAFALQDILENFVAGIILQLRRPFTAGDEIESCDHEGTVASVDARTVTVRTPDGELVRLPSAEVIKNPIINHTALGRRRTTVDVGVAYGTDLDMAARVAAEAAAGAEGVRSWPEPDALVHTFGESSIDIAVRFWHEPTILARWQTRDSVVRAIARAFDDNQITIPFPQRVLHPAPTESPSGGD
ncbi:MAG: mechanosensitive ion channel family protein [Acidimicrobiales bacterium]